mmetsp:Transcript_1023/g.2515  ORF Transcript_1023/g.2515 Transcript_1023/m.2515 type:complete len:220 (-) Transcript_1023:415-1074(-)
MLRPTENKAKWGRAFGWVKRRFSRAASTVRFAARPGILSPGRTWASRTSGAIPTAFRTALGTATSIPKTLVGTLITTGWIWWTASTTRMPLGSLEPTARTNAVSDGAFLETEAGAWRSERARRFPAAPIPPRTTLSRPPAHAPSDRLPPSRAILGGLSLATPPSPRRLYARRTASSRRASGARPRRALPTRPSRTPRCSRRWAWSRGRTSWSCVTRALS